jgi:Uma2 family endonuclease
MNTAADNWLPRHRIDVDAFHRMVETGILAADARVELIHGEMLDMAPIGSTHAGLVNRFIRVFEGMGERAILTVQQPLRLDRYSEPQPDIALLKPRADFYGRKHPTAEDVLLLVEVSDTSLRYDREVKVPLYAQHGVTELWLLDTQARQLTCWREPIRGQYSSSVVLSSGVLQVAALPGVAVDLDWILGY